MTFLKNVLHDLVEKRLWPIAVALLIALVAVPLVLGRGGDDASSAGDPVALAPAPAAVPTAVAADEVVQLAEDTTTEKVKRAGKLIDPFVQHHQPKAEDDDSTSGTSTTQSVNQAVQTTQSVVDSLGSLGGGSSPGASSGGSTGGSSTPTTTTTTPKPQADVDDKDLYRVSVRFGEDGAMKTYKDITRLTPLPSADDPFFVFLGVTEDKKSAVFLVSADAVPTGDGTCRPSTEDCSQVVMQKRDLEFFELQTGTAGVLQYQLEVLAITKGKAKTTATAAKLRARESSAGRDYLREVMASEPERLDGWGFSKKTGLLIEKESVREDVGHLPAAVARAAAGEAPEGTATVLTVPVGAEG